MNIHNLGVYVTACAFVLIFPHFVASFDDLLLDLITGGFIGVFFLLYCLLEKLTEDRP